MVESMIRCLNADLACFRSSEEPQLMQREEQTFAPLLSWLADDVGLKLAVSHTFKLTHPAEAEPRARELLAQADDWELAALDMMTGASKSFVISLAVSHGRIDAESAAKAARTAEQYQIDEWGAVEAGHERLVVGVTQRQRRRARRPTTSASARSRRRSKRHARARTVAHRRMPARMRTRAHAR